MEFHTRTSIEWKHAIKWSLYFWSIFWSIYEAFMAKVYLQQINLQIDLQWWKYKITLETKNQIQLYSTFHSFSLFKSLKNTCLPVSDKINWRLFESRMIRNIQFKRVGDLKPLSDARFTKTQVDQTSSSAKCLMKIRTVISGPRKMTQLERYALVLFLTFDKTSANQMRSTWFMMKGTCIWISQYAACRLLMC